MKPEPTRTTRWPATVWLGAETTGELEAPAVVDVAGRARTRAWGGSANVVVGALGDEEGEPWPPVRRLVVTVTVVAGTVVTEGPLGIVVLPPVVPSLAGHEGGTARPEFVPSPPGGVVGGPSLPVVVGEPGTEVVEGAEVVEGPVPGAWVVLVVTGPDVVEVGAPPVLEGPVPGGTGTPVVVVVLVLVGLGLVVPVGTVLAVVAVLPVVGPVVPVGTVVLVPVFVVVVVGEVLELVGGALVPVVAPVVVVVAAGAAA